jgi:branched-chain amino acid transport system ATP-binding protein
LGAGAIPRPLYAAPVIQASETIKIATALPMTGSSYGQTITIVNAVRLAIEEVGRKVGSFDIEFESWDDATAAAGQWDPAKAAELANRALGDPPPGTPLLHVAAVHTYYGSIQALRGISLTVWPGEVVTLIGSNGAGKSTTLKTISGLLRPRQGEILLDGRRLDRRPPHEIVRLGVSQVPEGRRIFPRLTVDENLQMGSYARRDRKGIAADRERVLTLFPRLKERLRQKAGTLSGGEQQMLAIGRALMAAPRLLLLDEPSMGLAPVLVDAIFDAIREINGQGQGVTVLLVEQNAQLALSIAHRGYVLQTGNVVLEDSAEGLTRNPHVRRVYLGEALAAPVPQPAPARPALLPSA